MLSEMPPNATVATDGRTGDELDRLRRGELTEAEYLERCVEARMALVRGRISTDDLEMIRELLLELFDTDPALVELKRRLFHPRRST